MEDSKAIINKLLVQLFNDILQIEETSLKNGVISDLSNVAPQTAHDICQLYFDGKVKESAKLQLEYLDLINALFIEVNPIPVKTALRLMGFEMGPLRMPLFDMLESNYNVLKEKLSLHKII